MSIKYKLWIHFYLKKTCIFIIIYRYAHFFIGFIFKNYNLKIAIKSSVELNADILYENASCTVHIFYCVYPVGVSCQKL